MEFDEQMTGVSEIRRVRAAGRAIGWSLVLMAVFMGCQGERRETPTRGNLAVVVAESVGPVIREEQKKFEEIYPEAHVTLLFASTREAITRLFNDSITMIVTSRPLNAEERDVAARAKMTVHDYKIALDGVALIVNNENPVSRLRTTQIDSILTGAMTTWSGVGGRKSGAGIEVCLPDRNTGTFEFLAMKVLGGKQIAAPASVAANSDEMLSYVSGHPDALGFVGANWLGVNNNKDRVKPLELCDPLSPDSLGLKDKYFSPHQAYFYQRSYPLTREIFVLSRADNYGVAAGFTSFMTSAPGQKIIVQNGLAPATMPVRLVELTNRSVPQ